MHYLSSAKERSNQPRKMLTGLKLKVKVSKMRKMHKQIWFWPVPAHNLDKLANDEALYPWAVSYMCLGNRCKYMQLSMSQSLISLAADLKYNHPSTGNTKKQPQLSSSEVGAANGCKGGSLHHRWILFCWPNLLSQKSQKRLSLKNKADTPMNMPMPNSWWPTLARSTVTERSSFTHLHTTWKTDERDERDERGRLRLCWRLVCLF